MHTNLPKIQLQNVSIRKETLNNVDYLVVPVIAIKEGVLNDLYYSSDVIKNSVDEWNGSPITINHPVDSNGNFISANKPEVEGSVVIGKLFNCRFEDNSLKGDIYINISQCESAGYSEIIEKFNNGEMVEVSTGLRSPIVNSKGDYNGQSYTGVIQEIWPDHLAILPNELGACSIKDGCGAMRVNCDTNKKCSKCNASYKKQAIELINQLGLTVNQLSFDDIYKALDNLLYDQYGDMFPFIIEVYSDYFIYVVGSTYYRQPYTITNSDNVEFNGNFEIVVRVVSYESDTQNRTQGFGSPSYLEANMTNEEEKTEEEKVEAPVEKEEVSNAGVVLSEEDAKLFETLKRRELQRISELKEKVLANNKHLTEELVNAMDSNVIEALAKGVSEKADYSAQGVVVNSDDAPKITPILRKKPDPSKIKSGV